LESKTLSVARRGEYPVSVLSNISAQDQVRWFKRGSGVNEGTVKSSKELKDLIRYKRLNLMDSWPMTSKFDVSFCRNVAIYFDNETREKIIDRFANQLSDNGYLFVGHSETLFGVTTRFECVGKTIYKKVC